MKIQIILAFVIIGICLFGIAAQIYRITRIIKESKELEQKIDELITEIDNETIHNNRSDLQAD
jgi:hypothetical protein